MPDEVANTLIWSNWLPIYDQIDYCGPAVYKVRVSDAAGESFKLGRLFKADENGILSIGQSGNMKQRRKNAVSGIQGATGHSSMNLMYYLYTFTKFGQHFSGHQLQFSFSKCENKDKAESVEHDLIKNYFKEYGEVPPLNSAMPKRYENWD